MMVFISVSMYTTSYIARDCKCLIQSPSLWAFTLPVQIRLGEPANSDVYTPSLFISDPRVQHEHAIQKEALQEYWEKRGGAPDHH